MSDETTLATSASSRASTLVGWGLGLACLAYLLTLPPTLNHADESFILYEAKRVLQGQVPYRDFFDFLLPGSYYFYALAYLVGGVSIASVRVATSLLWALSAVCTYFLALRVASMAEALLAGLLVVVICVPVWNMASHHWIATCFGLASAAVMLAPRWQGSARARPAAVGALAGLVICTHQGRGTWLVAWLLVAAPLLVLGRGGTGRLRRCLRELAWIAVGGAAVCAVVLGYTVWRGSFAEMWYATFTFVNQNYRSHNVGSSRFFGNARWATHNFWSGNRVAYTYLWLFDSIPALLVIAAIGLLWAISRHGLRTQLNRTALLLLALSAVGGISYFPGIAHVAFVTPFVLPVLAGMVWSVRTLGFLRARPAQLAMRTVWLLALALVLHKGWTNHQLAWTSSPVTYETAFGTIAGSKLDRNTIRELRQALRVDEGTTPRMFVYPTDAWIYLALPADNPTPFSLLRPGYNSPRQFQTVQRDLMREPRATVLVNFRLTKRGDPIMKFLHGNFHRTARVGSIEGRARVGYLYWLYARNP